jgi:predicted porin
VAKEDHAVKDTSPVDDDNKGEQDKNVITYTGFGFSGWKSGLQRLFLTTKGKAWFLLS